MRNSHREKFAKKRWDETVLLPKRRMTETEELIRKLGSPMEEGVYSDSKAKHMWKIADWVEDIRGKRWGERSKEGELSDDIEAIYSLLLPRELQANICIPVDLNRILKILVSERNFFTNRGMLTPAHIMELSLQKRQKILTYPHNYLNYAMFAMVGVLRELNYDAKVAFKQMEIEMGTSDGAVILNSGIVVCTALITPDNTNKLVIAGIGRNDCEYDSVFIPDEESAMGVAALLTAANAVMKYLTLEKDIGRIKLDIMREIIRNLECAQNEIADGTDIIVDFMAPLFDILERTFDRSVIDALSRSRVVYEIIESGKERLEHINDFKTASEIAERAEGTN
ncbi:MAG: hypothetical protein Q7S22_04090 [Candidatus Micrarchaeota archaeon]|nr:hypothetical protein [Candidatus Micrarchaeota archaeon]